jgi:hypothetical protein
MNRLATAGLGLALVAAPLVATTATAGAATAERNAAPAFSVSASINRATAIADQDVVKIRGTVSPKAVGEKVVLQQRMDGKRTWSVSSTAKIKPTGKFLLKDDPSTAGTRFYRVLKPAGSGMAKGVSNELKLVVYKWELLGQRARGPVTNMSNKTAVIATDTYPTSLVNTTAGSPASVEYTLGKKCLKLRATYALDDSTATGGNGMVQVKKDGVLGFASGLALGQVITNEIDITDAFRISVELTSSATPAAFVAVASPEVLCTN